MYNNNNKMHKLTKFEISRVIGIRAEQIANGAPACIDTNGMTDPIDIAEQELLQKKSPISILREMPNGKIQCIRVSETI